MRKFATLNSQNKLARHRLQVELWRQRQRKRTGGSEVDTGTEQPDESLGIMDHTVGIGDKPEANE